MASSLLLCATLAAAGRVPTEQVSAQLVPTHLRCEYHTDPIGIDVAAPRLSWIVESSERGARQEAYRILVASSPELLRRDQGDLWDSQRVVSSQTTHVPYAGRPLRSGERAYWRVTVWDQRGHAERTSPTALWEMGLLHQSDWKAKWIGMPETFPYFGEASKASWIWYPEGNPAQDAPGGDRLFRYAFNVPSGNISTAYLGFAVDDEYSAKLNGQPIAKGAGWTHFTFHDIKGTLRPGNNVLEVTGTNGHSRAGAIVAGLVKMNDGTSVHILSGPSWETNKGDGRWVKAMVLAPFNGQPYGPPGWSGAAAPAPLLRRNFEVHGPIRRARAYVSAKGLYKFYIDGKRVGNDIFTPGWTDYNKRIQYQTYDITSMLRQGHHAVGMMLGDGWYCGNIGLTGRNNYGPRPMGLAQIEIEYADGSHETVSSGDPGWIVNDGPIRSDDLLMGETYDARKFNPLWNDVRNPADDWPAADVEALGEIPLVAQYSPTVQTLTELKPLSIDEPKPGVFVYDLGQNMVGWARLKVKGPAGTTVRLRFAEMLNPDKTVYTTNLRGAKATDYYTLSGKGDEVYEPSFTFHGFRYVEVTGFPGKPDKSAITGVVVGSNTPQTGTFECSDPLVNQLQHNIFWGQRGNYLEVPTDCPQRDERLGWMGDAQIFARTACFNNDVAAFLTKWTQDVVDAQGPSGGFSDVSPRKGDPNDGAPAWGDAGVIVPWTVYVCYGDRRLLEERYPAMQKWIEYIDSANPDHIWTKRANNNFGDWLNVQDDTPRDVLATAYFAYSTELVGKSARVLGKPTEAAHYEALHDQIVKAFNARFVDAEGKIKGDTQTAYVLALRFGLLPEAKRAAASKRLVDHIAIDRKGHLSTGFVGVGYLNPTLTAIGRPDVAYRLLLNDTYPSWGYSIRQGATTIWERWDGWTQEKGFQDPGMNSFNHYSLGSVGEWMYRTVAGIDLDPETPGYEHIVVHPIPGGGMTWAKGSLDSMHGRIESGWKLVGRRFELNLTIPTNTVATVYVPAKRAEDVREGGSVARDAEGVRFLRMEGDSAVFRVGGGKYRFVAERG